MREAPITPALVAMKRIVAASRPTYTFSTESSVPFNCSSRKPATMSFFWAARVSPKVRSVLAASALALAEMVAPRGDASSSTITIDSAVESPLCVVTTTGSPTFTSPMLI